MKSTADTRRITLFRDHPAEGWTSMERYADSLLRPLRRMVPAGWRVNDRMPPTPWPTRYGLILARMFRYPLWASRQEGDLFHILDHSYGQLLLGLDPERTIVTVHDIAAERFQGRRLGISSLAWRWAWLGVRRARHVIVVSAFTAAELNRTNALAQANLLVIPNGVSPAFHPLDDKQVRELRERYLGGNRFLLLHVGSTHSRKNLQRLLRALALIRKSVPVALVQIGGRPDAQMVELTKSLSLENNVHFVGLVSDEQLMAYYNAADLFVFPSLYEGFGLPVLEAMACGTPVACSDSASLPEVAGEAAIYFEANDVRRMAATILEILQDGAARDRLRQLGLQRAAEYSWQRSAELTLQLYKDVLAG